MYTTNVEVDSKQIQNRNKLNTQSQPVRFHPFRSVSGVVIRFDKSHSKACVTCSLLSPFVAFQSSAEFSKCDGEKWIKRKPNDIYLVVPIPRWRKEDEFIKCLLSTSREQKTTFGSYPPSSYTAVNWHIPKFFRICSPYLCESTEKIKVTSYKHEDGLPLATHRYQLKQDDREICTAVGHFIF